jgi:anti-sigma B factor antagonist
MNEPSLTIRGYEEPGRHVLVLAGELDMAGVPRFEAAAVQLCELGRGELLVDISDVAFIDSTGVRAILQVKAACERRNCEFSMTHAGEQGERLFEVTRLLEHLPFRSRSRPQRFRREIELWPDGAGGQGAGPRGESASAAGAGRRRPAV